MKTGDMIGGKGLQACPGRPPGDALKCRRVDSEGILRSRFLSIHLVFLSIAHIPPHRRTRPYAHRRDPSRFELWLTLNGYYDADEVQVDEYEAYMNSRPVKIDH